MQAEETDDIKLSPHALEALASFYQDRDEREKRFEDLKTRAEDEYEAQNWSMEAFQEDWNVSQFWYSDETATLLAKKLLENSTKNTKIAVVSAPSVFIQLKNLTASMLSSDRPYMRLLEYDKRFEVFNKQFVFYDFGQPFKLPDELKGQFDRVIVDPPFLSDDCQTKAALTVRWLSRPSTSDSVSKLFSASSSSLSPSQLILCTGERMQNLVLRLYEKSGLKTTSYKPVHSKGLSNEFFCYANFECPEWSFETTSS